MINKNSKIDSRTLSYIFTWLMCLFMILSLFIPVVQVFVVGEYFHSYDVNGFSFLGFSCPFLENITKLYEFSVSSQNVNFIEKNLVLLTSLVCWAMILSAIILAIITVIKFLKGEKVPKACNIVAIVMFCIYGFIGIIVGINCAQFASHIELEGVKLGGCYFSLTCISIVIGVILCVIIRDYRNN